MPWCSCCLALALALRPASGAQLVASSIFGDPGGRPLHDSVVDTGWLPTAALAVSVCAFFLTHCSYVFAQWHLLRLTSCCGESWERTLARSGLTLASYEVLHAAGVRDRSALRVMDPGDWQELREKIPSIPHRHALDRLRLEAHKKEVGAARGRGRDWCLWLLVYLAWVALLLLLLAAVWRRLAPLPGSVVRRHEEELRRQGEELTRYDHVLQRERHRLERYEDRLERVDDQLDREKVRNKAQEQRLRSLEKEVLQDKPTRRPLVEDATALGFYVWLAVVMMVLCICFGGFMSSSEG